MQSSAQPSTSSASAGQGSTIDLILDTLDNLANESMGGMPSSSHAGEAAVSSATAAQDKEALWYFERDQEEDPEYEEQWENEVSKKEMKGEEDEAVGWDG